MADTIKRVDYFYLAVEDKPGEFVRVLGRLKEHGVNLLNSTAFPTTAGRAQVDVVPADTGRFLEAAKKAGLKPGEKKRAFLVQGQDRVGAVAEVLKRLADASINVTAYNACAAQGGGWGMILWVKAADYERAAKALGV